MTSSVSSSAFSSDVDGFVEGAATHDPPMLTLVAADLLDFVDVVTVVSYWKNMLIHMRIYESNILGQVVIKAVGTC